MVLELRSPAFEHEHPLPARFTCEGEDLSPPLVIRGVPGGAESLALIVDDPDAPDPRAPAAPWVHWVLYNLPPDVRELPEGARPQQLPLQVRQGQNGWRRPGYAGPCPPVGRHRVVFELYALDVVLPDLGIAPKDKLLRALAGHVLERAVLLATYEKASR